MSVSTFKTHLVVVGLGCLLAASVSSAQTFRGSATTVVRLFELRHDLPGLEDVDYRPVDQLLNLSWDGLGKQGAWTVDATLRGRLDLESDVVAGEEELRVLLAEARWRSPKGAYGLTLGRQRSLVGLGWRAYDGARFDLKPKHWFRGFVHAGFPVELGENGWADGKGATWGAGARFQLGPRASLGFDHQTRKHGSRVVEQTAGLDFSFRRGAFTLDANADYSFPHEAFGDSTVIFSQRVKGKHLIEARITRVEPTPATDTVFVVYDINPYTETRLSYERQSSAGLSYGLFFSHENYVTTGFPGPQDIDRAALTARYRAKKHDASHRSELGWQKGFSGKRLAVRHDVDLNVAARWRLGLGASINRYQNAYRLDESDEEAALRARVTFDSSGRWDLTTLLEQYWGRSRDTLRGTLIFTLKLGKRRSLRPWWSPYSAEGWERGRQLVAPRETQETDAGSDGKGEAS